MAFSSNLSEFHDCFLMGFSNVEYVRRTRSARKKSILDVDYKSHVCYYIAMNSRKTCVSLFSCGGIGEISFHKNNIHVLVSNEIDADRHSVYETNFPESRTITGDIWQNVGKIVEESRDRLKEQELDLIYATPPCQGMSKNGRGKLLNQIRAGQKPEQDERNLLIVPALRIICALRPKVVIFENVPEMLDTSIFVDGILINIVEYIRKELGKDYFGNAQVVEFADYGIPQRRQRLISVFSRDPKYLDHYTTYGTLIPFQTHSKNGSDGLKKWVTLKEVIYDTPALDASSEETASYPKIPFHHVPLLDKEKYFWVSNTPPEKSAFDNQCIQCGYSNNTIHGSTYSVDGINRLNEDTPLYCEKCGALLPRPCVNENGKRRIMKGFTSAYKRMSWNSPSPALTRNLSYACSDNKLHPDQNRVLSLYEAMIIHTINSYDYQWKRADGKKVSDKLIRELIGESIPPMFIDLLILHLRNIELGIVEQNNNCVQKELLFV